MYSLQMKMKIYSSHVQFANENYVRMYSFETNEKLCTVSKRMKNYVQFRNE
jgi:hypothetical protein